MSNSPLVSKTLLSPNHSNGREGHAIDTITIHHTAGVLSLENCLDWFAKPSTYASCNYIVGYDGRIGLCVEEKHRAWTTSSRANDNRAITLEVINSATGGQWPVSKKAYEAMLDLVTDICRRNNIKKLIFTGDKTGNLTMHKWFSNTNCPGPYLEAREAAIAAEVTRRLNNEGEIEMQMTKEELKKFIKDTVKNEVDYRDISNVPSWWRNTIQTLLDEDVINGGTDKSVNATDVNLTYTEAKLCAIMVRYVDKKFDKLLEEIKKIS